MEKNAAAPGRVAWMDTAKGVAMLLVLIGHCMRDEMRAASPALDMLYRGIYCFHMPWFFWLSGFGYFLSRRKGRRPLTIAVRRLKTQFPYWLGYSLFIFAVFMGAISLRPLREVLESAGYKALSLPAYLLSAIQANNPWAYHLWFLLILILVTLIVGLADAAFRGAHTRAVCGALIALSVAGMALRDQLPLGGWWRVFDYATMYLPMFCLGILMAEWQPPRRLVWVWGALGLAYIVVRTAFFSDFSGNSLRVTGLARCAVYVMADLLLPGVMVACHRLFERGVLVRTKPGKRFISFLGRESLVIYLWHQPFCCAFLGMLLYGRLHIPALPTMAACFAASLAVSWAFAWLRDRVKGSLRKRGAAR